MSRSRSILALLSFMVAGGLALPSVLMAASFAPVWTLTGWDYVMEAGNTDGDPQRELWFASKADGHIALVDGLTGAIAKEFPDFVKDNTVLTSVVNCNSPLVWDATMLDALKVYAAHNQPCLLSPFALCGASTAASTVGAVAQVNAEALAGLAFTQLVRPGSPQVYGQFMVTVDMKSGAPMGGTPEAAHMMMLMGQLARKYKLPWRTSGFHVGSKLPDAQAGYEANMLMHAAILSGANYIWHVAGWLEAGLCAGYSKFVTDAEQLASWYKYGQGLSFSDFQDAMQAVREVGPAGHFLGTQHTLEHFESAFFMPSLMDFSSFEQWSAEGSKDYDQRVREKARAMLAQYEEPKLDEAVDEALRDFIARRERELPMGVS